MKLLDPQFLISTFGVLGILVIVFAESGLLIGFVLPGDSLLFTAGLLIAQGAVLQLPLWQMCLLISAAAVAGDQVGYATGRRLGPPMFRRPNSRLFKQENLGRAQQFFDQHGGPALILARFVPVVRTFTPIVAGTSRMPYRAFMLYNVIGGVVWACSVTALGYFLGHLGFVREHIELMVTGIVILSVLPITTGWLRSRHGRTTRSARRQDAVPDNCRFDLSVAVSRSPADVYAFLADVQDAEPIPRRAVVRMVKEPPGPTAPGTVWHESVRLMPGMWLHVDSVVTETSPADRLSMDFRSAWFTGDLTYEFEPAANGTVLRQREQLTPRWFLRPLRGAIDWQLRSRLQQRLNEIKEIVENECDPSRGRGLPP